METVEKREKRTHHGHAIKRLRQTLGIKQDALAFDLGISQQCVSTYEHKPVIEDDMLEKFASALNVTTDLIKELEEDPVTVIIENNTFEKGSVGNALYSEVSNFGNTYNNPIEELLKINQEKQALYERMLELEKGKAALLEKLLKEKK